MAKINLLIAIGIIAAAIGYTTLHKKPAVTPTLKNSTNHIAKIPVVPPAKPAFNYCAGNTDQEILVSISKQHLWACQDVSLQYDSAVITGMQIYPADLTPTGTYKIYGKQVNQTLAGHDNTGSWSDFVNYWMPFLNNQYGTYGFHDLTTTANGANGRADSDFGNVDIYAPYTAAKHASHGCVELPLATAKWIYDWAPVGTTVVIQS